MLQPAMNRPSVEKVHRPCCFEVPGADLRTDDVIPPRGVPIRLVQNAARCRDVEIFVELHVAGAKVELHVPAVVESLGAPHIRPLDAPRVDMVGRRDGVEHHRQIKIVDNRFLRLRIRGGGSNEGVDVRADLSK